jgi:hypothetical protein
LIRAVNKFFGSWNKGMEELGFKPNTEHMLRLNLVCKDGHRADSQSERIIDDYLFESKIEHERSKLYPNSKRNCDFYLTDFDVWIEYFGLTGISEYDEIVLEKKALVNQYNLKFIAILPEDLKNLDTILKCFKKNKTQ